MLHAHRGFLRRDNVFIERFWRTIKYEEVYLRAYETVSHARESIARYIAFHNVRRPYTALAERMPDAVLPMKLAVDERAVVCARSVLGGLHHEYSLAPAST